MPMFPHIIQQKQPTDRWCDLRLCARIRAYNVGKGFKELGFAICRDFMPRDCVKEALTTSWPIFAERQLGELLLPLARALAWSYCIDEREDVAIKLLKHVWHRRQPFCQLEGDPAISKERSPSYAIVGSLLLDLVDESERGSIKVEMERLDSSRSRLLAFPIRVSETVVTLETSSGPDTIAVFFPLRLPFGSSVRKRGPYCLRRGVGRWADAHANAADLRRRVGSLHLSDASSTYTNPYLS